MPWHASPGAGLVGPDGPPCMELGIIDLENRRIKKESSPQLILPLQPVRLLEGASNKEFDKFKRVGKPVLWSSMSGSFSLAQCLSKRFLKVSILIERSRHAAGKAFQSNSSLMYRF